MRAILFPFGALGRNEVLANHIAKNLVHELRFFELVDCLGKVARQILQAKFGDFGRRKLEQVFLNRRAQCKALCDARETGAKQVLVATEVGMLHQLRKAAPGVDFQAVNDRASCPYMKMITPAALLRCLREGRDEVFVDTDVAERARKSVERMIAIGNPGSGE